VNEILAACNEQFNGMAGFLWSLAADRYRTDTNLGRRWILTGHLGADFRGYTDGEYSVISIPFNERKKEATLLFCNHYNLFVHKEVDKAVQSEKIESAKKVLLILNSLKINGDDQAERKLKLIKELEQSPKDKETVKKVLEITGDIGLTHDFKQLDEMRLKRVKNLAELEGGE